MATRTRVPASPPPAAPAAPAAPPPLPVDSLAYGLLLAARAVSAVIGGQSLTEALAAQRGEPAAARAAAQDLAYGALRRYGWGDFILGRLLERPLQNVEVRALLLATLYRLETRPEAAHTVVDQAVTAAAQLAQGNFRGLVNGVLRNYLRQHAALLAAAADDDVAQHWHPAWWLARLRAAYPADWPAVVAAGNAQPPMALRVNRRRSTVAAYQARLTAAGIAAEAMGDDGLLLARPVSVEALPDFAAGAVSVQDLGAQRAASLLDCAPGMRVLDACAAPGGKTAHLLERADLDLTALEIDPRRVRRITENLARLGLSATVATGDGCRPADWWDGRPFDRILADVPCSASGVVRRHPDGKWLRRKSDILQLAKVQAALLDALWPLLAPGGKLLYATCSVFTEENAGRVAAFLAGHRDAERLFEEQLLPRQAHDGFYYALLRKLA